MTQIAALDVEMRARNTQFNTEMRNAEQRTRMYSRAAQDADSRTKLLSSTFSNAATSVSIIDGPMGGVASRLNAISSGMSKVGIAGVGFGLAFAATTRTLKNSLFVYAELEQRQARTEAILKSTGGVVGLTAKELDTMARSTALATLASTEGIREAQDVLLTFRSVNYQVFGDAIRLSQDMAVVMGGTAKTAAMQLGKALEDPIAGINSLRRSGVSFTESQRDMIKEMVESGRKLEAQKLIIEAVQNQVGGAGGAEAGGLTGQVDTLGQRWSELNEVLGRFVSNSGATQSSISILTRATQGWIHTFDPSFLSEQSYLDDLVRQREEAKERLDKAGSIDNLRFGNNPFRYDRNNYQEDDALVKSLNEQIQAIQNKRVEEQKAANEARKAADLAQEAAAEEAKAAAAAERRAQAVKEVERAMSRTSGYWSELFKDPKSEKPKERNMFFDMYARNAKDAIDRGSPIGAQEYLDRARQSITTAQSNPYRNYDVGGMESVLKTLEALARVKWDDLGKAADTSRAERDGTGSVLEFEGAGQSLKLVAETSQQLTQEFNNLKGIVQEQARQTAGGDVTRRVDVKVEIVEGRMSFSDGRNRSAVSEVGDAVRNSIQDAARAVLN